MTKNVKLKYWICDYKRGDKKMKFKNVALKLFHYSQSIKKNYNTDIVFVVTTPK